MKRFNFNQNFLRKNIIKLFTKFNVQTIAKFSLSLILGVIHLNVFAKNIVAPAKCDGTTAIYYNYQEVEIGADDAFSNIPCGGHAQVYLITDGDKVYLKMSKAEANHMIFLSSNLSQEGWGGASFPTGWQSCLP